MFEEGESDKERRGGKEESLKFEEWEESLKCEWVSETVRKTEKFEVWGSEWDYERDRELGEMDPHYMWRVIHKELKSSS